MPGEAAVTSWLLPLETPAGTPNPAKVRKKFNSTNIAEKGGPGPHMDVQRVSK